MKTCRKYLTHVQKSVFEGMLTEGKLNALKRELESKIVPVEDAICIYKIDNLKFTSREKIGVVKEINNII